MACSILCHFIKAIEKEVFSCTVFDVIAHREKEEIDFGGLKVSCSGVQSCIL